MSTTQGTIFCSLIALPFPLTVATSFLLGRPLFGLGNPTIACLYFALWAIILKFITLPYFFNPYRHLPAAPDTSFVLGNIKVFINRPNGQKFLEWMQRVPNNGLIYSTGLFHIGDILVPTTLDGYMEAMNTNCYDWTKPTRSRDVLARILGTGLLVAEQEQHKMQRKNGRAAFTGTQVKGLVPVFWSKAQNLAQAMSRTLSVDETKTNRPRVGLVNFRTWSSRATLDVIGVAGVGRDFGTVDNADDEIAKTYQELLCEEIIPFFVVNLLLPEWFTQFLPLKMNKVVKTANAKLRLHLDKVIAERKQLLAKQEKLPHDLLSTLIASHMFTDEGLVDQLLSFLAAGHETTSNTLVWSTYQLSRQPELQQRLREEVRAVMRPDAVYDAALLDEMPYLNAFCNEILRFYPVVGSTGREAIRDTTLQGQRVTKGTEIALAPWAINRLAELWGPDAEEFNPGRWLKDEADGGATNKLAFMTFLHGPRSCIGQAFARAELKCLLATVVYHFHWALADPEREVRPAGAITIEPYGAYEYIITEVQ